MMKPVMYYTVLLLKWCVLNGTMHASPMEFKLLHCYVPTTCVQVYHIGLLHCSRATVALRLHQSSIAIVFRDKILIDYCNN